MAKIYSSNPRIDSVLSDSQQPTAPVLSWSTSTTVGSAVSLTYSFLTSAPATVPADNFQPFTSAIQALVPAAMAEFSDVANITITSVASGGNLELGTVDFGGTLAGFQSGLAQLGFTIIGNPVTNTYITNSDVWLTNRFPFILDLNEGSKGYVTLLHEVGHGLGLEHTFANMLPPTGTDDNRYSIMSYTDHPGMSTEATSLMLYDIAALQYLYGANMTTRRGDTVYSWDTDTSKIETIWDAGGNDTFDASNQSRNVVIDLNDGAFSSIGSNGSGGDASQNIAIAYNAVIENAVGGSGDDTLTGNASANILIGKAGADMLDGGGGADTASYEGSSAGVSVNLLTGTASGGDAAGDTLSNIESLKGSDHNDVLTGTSTNNALRGEGGNDILRPYQGGDFIDGGAGIDILDYSYTGVALNINMATKSGPRVEGYTGPGGYSQTVYNIEFIRATAGDDYIRSDINLALTVYGYGGNDIMIGFNGKDRLIGGTGDDRISGGVNNDLIYGEAGADTFYAINMMGRDEVMDWEDGVDKLDMRSTSGAKSFADINVSNGSKGAFVWWDADANGGGAANGFWLVGQPTSVVDATDFIF